MKRPRLPRPSMVMLPNGFTLGNLFCGVFAIVNATRGELNLAVTCILVGGVCDALDGRVARATNTGSRFGEELDSLVDAISFGLAPALIMYFAVLRRDNWDWLFVFWFAACAVMRLARSNVEQAGHSKRYFRGLPSPAAGGVLASYYWFSQTSLFQQTSIGDLPWHTYVRILMAALSFLMISNVPYLAWPTFNLRSWRGVIGLLVFVGLGVGLVFLPKQFFFPVGLLYVVTGVLAAVVGGLLEKQSHRTEDHEVAGIEAYELPDDDEDTDIDDEVVPEATVATRESEQSRRRRRRRRGRRGPGSTPDKDQSEGSPE